MGNLNRVSEDSLNESKSISQQEEVNYKKYLSFMIDTETFALDALIVQEIIEYSNVTRIPTVPSYIRGVTNLRGSVVPVIDLSVRLGKRVTPQTNRTCIIIVKIVDDGESMDVGVLIDGISEVFNIDEKDIEPAPSFGAGMRTDFIDGMGKIEEQFIVLLNQEKVLSIGELSNFSDFKERYVVPDSELYKNDNVSDIEK